MRQSKAQFSTQELVQVLSHYETGIIHQVKPFEGGNRRTPKAVIECDRGKFLLKRRPKGHNNLYRVAFGHSVQTRLAETGFPVTRLLATRNNGQTALQLKGRIYELFRFVEGSRYDGSPQATQNAGKYLAKFHSMIGDFGRKLNSLRDSFHDSSIVRKHLKMLRSSGGKSSAGIIAYTLDDLSTLYNESSGRVNELGFDSWPEKVIHGDWHPGNMLFSGTELAGVVDFDAVRLAPSVVDLANAMVHFSIVAGRPNPVDWPDYLDQKKLILFLSGYLEVRNLQENMIRAIPDLMIEAMITEAVLPVAATGFFGNLSGEEFLAMIHRKALWVKEHRKLLLAAMLNIGRETE